MITIASQWIVYLALIAQDHSDSIYYTNYRECHVLPGSNILWCSKSGTENLNFQYSITMQKKNLGCVKALYSQSSSYETYEVLYCRKGRSQFAYSETSSNVLVKKIICITLPQLSTVWYINWGQVNNPSCFTSGCANRIIIKIVPSITSCDWPRNDVGNYFTSLYRWTLEKTKELN